jgi:hypothetical protein
VSIFSFLKSFLHESLFLIPVVMPPIIPTLRPYLGVSEIRIPLYPGSRGRR